MVKALTTPSFALVGLGWALAFMTVAYVVFEVAGFRALARPLVMIGRNSVIVYSIDLALRGWLQSSVAVFTRGFPLLGRFGGVADLLTAGVAIWLVCLWLDRNDVTITL